MELWPGFDNHLRICARLGCLLWFEYHFPMNPQYLWLTDAVQLLTFFVVGPVLGIAIAYAAWRGKPQNTNPKRYGLVCVASGVTASLLFALAKWINADVRTAHYFLQLACFLVSGLLFGVFMGSGCSVLLGLWRWHGSTRLTDDNQKGR